MLIHKIKSIMILIFRLKRKTLILGTICNKFYLASQISVSDRKKIDKQNHTGFALVLTQDTDQNIIGRTRLMLYFF